MNYARGVNCCMRAISQRMWRRIPQVTSGFDERRSYKSDDPSKWPARRGENIREQVNNLYDEHRFHYKSNKDAEDTLHFGATGAKDPESRRRITQDTIDHQRRQERIIADNKRRWKNRMEPKVPSLLESDFTVYDKKKHRKSREGRDEDSAEEYSRRRRHQRLKEVKRQERELRESRRGYKLPSAEDTQKAPETPEPSYRSKSWLEQQAREEEEKYWHTWTTCPDERRVEDSAEEDSANDANSAPGDKPNQGRGFVKPTLPYDNSVRRFQTHSSQVVEGHHSMPPIEPPRYTEIKEHGNSLRRRPNGMEKQYMLARDSARPYPSLLQSHVFKSPSSAFGEMDDVMEMEDIELPQQPLRSKLYWQGLPRPVYKRFDGINRAVAKIQMQRKHSRRSVEPPRIGESSSFGALRRKRPPIDSFSDKLAVNPQNTPYSEYTGYGRQTVCDAWKNFTSFHNLKSK